MNTNFEGFLLSALLLAVSVIAAVSMKAALDGLVDREKMIDNDYEKQWEKEIFTEKEKQ
jgi:hypothetical protein